MSTNNFVGRYEITKSYTISAKDIIRLLPDSLRESILEHFGISLDDLKDACIFLNHGFNSYGEPVVNFHYSPPPFLVKYDGEV